MNYTDNPVADADQYWLDRDKRAEEREEREEASRDYYRRALKTRDNPDALQKICDWIECPELAAEAWVKFGPEAGAAVMQTLIDEAIGNIAELEADK